MAVTLINVFSVPKGKEDEFVKWWQDVKASITKHRDSLAVSFIGVSNRTADTTSLMLPSGKAKTCTGKPTRRARHP